jgi:hypothetical protein
MKIKILPILAVLFFMQHVKAESYEVTGEFTTPGGPDVVVTSLAYANGKFTSIVKNIGDEPTPPGIVIGVRYSVDGTAKTWGSINGPLAAGASVTIGTNGVSYTIPAGTHTITAWADDVNRFAEYDENNNKFSKSINR